MLKKAVKYLKCGGKCKIPRKYKLGSTDWYKVLNYSFWTGWAFFSLVYRYKFEINSNSHSVHSSGKETYNQCIPKFKYISKILKVNMEPLNFYSATLNHHFNLN